MFELKPISKDAIPSALEKAERLRLLNEPREAESVCLDVLAIEPTNQQALVTLLLALSDQFEREIGPAMHRAREIVPKIEDDYSRLYYEGILFERAAKARLRKPGPRAHFIAYEWLMAAMERFEEAAAIRPHGNDEAILRWNSCVRLLEANPALAAEAEEPASHMLE
ncbi:MAG TPA: hypothetical protein PK413_15510 [Thermoanaerobaculia bacterium]|nr:hypothetical protein [Thermoanaerobaculia bacterium]